MSTAGTASESSLASVVFVQERLEKWQRLDDSEPILEPLAQLHKKFWGKSMPIAEEALRVEKPLASNPSESDSTETGYVLDIDNQAINIKRIWSEYVRIYDYVVDYYNKKTKDREMAPAAVLTGQTGVGKTVWLYYALCRCLSEKRPVIWRNHRSPYMFVEDGVFHMGTDFSEAMYKSVVWTLVDSGPSRDGIPEEFVGHNTPFFVICATSPVRELWSQLHKTVSGVTVVVMNPWTRSEIHQAAALRPAGPSREIIDDTYDRWGPTPRLCLVTASDPEELEAYEDAVDRALEIVDQQSLPKLMRRLEDLNMDDITEKVFLIRREHTHNVRSKVCVERIVDRARR